MPEDQLRQAAQSYSTLMLIVGIGLLGIVVILGLFFVWRRSQRRMREMERERDRARQEATPHVDTWRTAAERLQTDDPPPRPPLIRPPGEPPPADAPPDEPWRESLGDLPYFQEERRREEQEMEEEDEDEDDELDDDEDDDSDDETDDDREPWR